MTPQETILLNQFSSPVSGPPRSSSSDNTGYIVQTLLRHRVKIGGTVIASIFVSFLIYFLLPPSYVAEATILPPQQPQSSLASFAAGAMGGLGANLGTQLGVKSSGDLYIGILKSRTISDDIINRFHLENVYEKRFMSEARKTLSQKANFVSGKDSLITIAVKDTDPRRAAAIANAFVDELHSQNSRLALTEAAQRRLFFEQQLNNEKEALAKAEVDLKTTQQSTRLLTPTGQSELLILSGSQLRAQIASRTVQLQATLSYATEENPEVQTLRIEIAALRKQLNELEADGTGAKWEVPGDKLPGATLEYVRKLRELKYHETLFELLAKQFEAAKVDEAKEAPLVQVVDTAVVPDKQTRLPTALVLVIAVVAGFSLGCAAAFLSENAVRTSHQQPAVSH